MKKILQTVILITGLILMTACSYQSSRNAPENTSSNNHSTTQGAVAATKASVSATAVKEKTSITLSTTELPLRDMNNTQKETKLRIPDCCDSFYVKNNHEIISDNWLAAQEPPAVSYSLNHTTWEEIRTPFDIERENKTFSSATDITQRPNGDYIFIAGNFGPEKTAAIVRMTATGKIKYYCYAKNLFSTERYLASMVYLGNNRALIQSTDPNIDALYSSVYEEKDTSVLHLDCINIKEGKIEQSYPDGMWLCAAPDENTFFAEYEKKLVKIKVKTGEILKKYSTEAIWSQGWSEETTDDSGIFFHDYPITWTAFDGTLYAKHVSGIYELDEKNLCWNQLLSYKKGFTIGPSFNNTFVMLDKNKAMLMGNTYDDECATDCCIYEWD